MATNEPIKTMSTPVEASAKSKRFGGKKLKIIGAALAGVILVLGVVGYLTMQGPTYKDLQSYTLEYEGQNITFDKPVEIKERDKKSNYVFMADTRQVDNEEGFYSGLFALVSPLNQSGDPDALYDTIKTALDQRSGEIYDNIVKEVQNYVEKLVSGTKNFKVSGISAFSNSDIKTDAWKFEVSFTTSNDVDSSGYYVIALSDDTNTEYDFSIFALNKVWKNNEKTINKMLDSINIK